MGLCEPAACSLLLSTLFLTLTSSVRYLMEYRAYDYHVSQNDVKLDPFMRFPSPGRTRFCSTTELPKSEAKETRTLSLIYDYC